MEFVAPIYMNPKQKKKEDERQRKNRKSVYGSLEEKRERELPDESTVSYYV